MEMFNTCQECASVLAKTSIFRKALLYHIRAFMKRPSRSFQKLPPRRFPRCRFFAGYGVDYRKGAGFLLGFKAEAEVSSSGSTVTLFYGPAFSIEYNFTRGAINEKHKRTTAFMDF